MSVGSDVVLVNPTRSPANCYCFSHSTYVLVA